MAARLIKDQNLDVHYDGAPIGGETPSEIPSPRKKISLNVSKANEKSHVGWGEATSDLGYSVNRPSSKKIKKKKQKQKKKLSAVAMEQNSPKDFAGVGLGHDHQLCTEAQKMAEDMETKYLLESVNGFEGEAPIGGETNISKAQKHGGIVKTKPLPDLSNSATPPEILSSSNKISLNVSEANEKSQVGGGKAITDLGNSVNLPSSTKKNKKKKKKKLIAVAEEQNCPKDFAWMGFGHNHQLCIEAKEMAMELETKYLLKDVYGFEGEDFSTPLASPQELTVSKPEKILDSAFYARWGLEEEFKAIMNFRGFSHSKTVSQQ